MAEAIFYLASSGRASRLLSRHFPPWQTVRSQLHRWRRDRKLKRMHDALRDHTRQKAGRHREPSAAVIDEQTSPATAKACPKPASP